MTDRATDRPTMVPEDSLESFPCKSSWKKQSFYICRYVSSVLVKSLKQTLFNSYLLLCLKILYRMYIIVRRKLFICLFVYLSILCLSVCLLVLSKRAKSNCFTGWLGDTILRTSLFFFQNILLISF